MDMIRSVKSSNSPPHANVTVFIASVTSFLPMLSLKPFNFLQVGII